MYKIIFKKFYKANEEGNIITYSNNNCWLESLLVHSNEHAFTLSVLRPFHTGKSNVH